MSKAIRLLTPSYQIASVLRLTARSQAYAKIPKRFVPLLARNYATQKSLRGSKPSNRKEITITNDDGHVEWGELSIKEKAARTTQQSFNLMIIVFGIVMTGGMMYLLYSDVFSTDSKTSHYSRALEQIKKDPRCVEMLGNSKEIRAHGGATSSRWSRTIIPPSTITTDRYGTHHLRMHFFLDGPLNSGAVNMHMTKEAGDKAFKYKYLALDVKGHTRLYLEKPETDNNALEKGHMKMFGVEWR